MLFGGEVEVKGEELFEQVVIGAKALGLEHQGIEFFVELVELAVGFVEVGVED